MRDWFPKLIRISNILKFALPGFGLKKGRKDEIPCALLFTICDFAVLLLNYYRYYPSVGIQDDLYEIQALG